MGIRHANHFDWSDETALATLKRMHAEGATASQIAKALGHGLTRNSVIGKIHRLGLFRSESRRQATMTLTNAFKPSPPRKLSAPAVKPTPKPAPGLSLRLAEKKTAPATPHLNRKGTVNFQSKPKVAQPEPIKAADEPRAFAPAPAMANTATGTPARICDDHFKPGGCKWPIGTPAPHDASEQLFCCGPRAPGEHRYCAEHVRVARSAIQPKRKSNPPPMGGGQAYRFGERRFSA